MEVDVSAELQPAELINRRRVPLLHTYPYAVHVKPTVFLDMSPVQHHYHPVLPPHVSSACFLLARISPVTHNLFTYLKIAEVFVTCTSGNL